MFLKTIVVSLLLVTLISLLRGSFALNYDGVEEYFQCQDTYPIDSKIQLEWMNDVQVWYTPFWNKIDYYQNAEDFFGKEEFLKLSIMDLEKTCVYYKPNATHVPIHGFGGRFLYYEATPDPFRKGVMHWAMKNSKTGEREYHATTYATKSDNKSYTFSATVWANGMKGFNVAASGPKLSDKVLNELKKHATELGFNPMHFVVQDYSKCPPPPNFWNREAILNNEKEL